MKDVLPDPLHGMVSSKSTPNLVIMDVSKCLGFFDCVNA
jgi:hypothetical protein